MEKFDVLIIGGGVSGLSCAITLGSAESKMDIVENKKILVLDSGESHLNKAELYNVAGVKEGTKGKDLLVSMNQKANLYKIVETKKDTVTKVNNEDNEYLIETQSGEKYKAEIVVFATGMQTIEIEGIGSQIIKHIRAPRPGMIMIENDNGIIEDGKYVTGCAAGASSMFSSAAGYGAQTATDILSLWAGKYTVIHDVDTK
ncbi:FAD-dependent oxidoreductase [Halarcobacter sp.]|uniref:FAD-dependent oxidoreductase n=1 Tax=Halarcobacter sp. TaxID=2321133 RepID=UPI0029F53320|nr:FAD-dependent oxidoreductase [Halarcobacter sp.]